MSVWDDEFDDLADERDEDEGDDEDDDLAERRVQFADPGGRSALRAAGPGNPRNLPCPTCHKPDRLTPKDAQCGYQCDECADRDESGF